MHDDSMQGLETGKCAHGSHHEKPGGQEDVHEQTHACSHRPHHSHHHDMQGAHDSEQRHHAKHSRRAKWSFWTMGLGSLAWLLLRSGTKPRRLAYPCQQAALTTSVGFLGYLASLFGVAHLYHRLKHKAKRAKRGPVFMAALAGGGMVILLLLAFLALPDEFSLLKPTYAQVTLPAWTSETAVSNVYAVENVPVPDCSLAAGLPTTQPCNDPNYALRDEGVDSLVNEMELRGDYFYKTAVHPTGTVGADDVVVIKVNNQWGDKGDGRFATNTDTLKGLIWRILQHPDGFTGEIVIAENTQSTSVPWDITPANAEDQAQSFQAVIDTFFNLGYPVYLFNWTDLNSNRISGGNINDSGYPPGEYINGNDQDAYIMLEDPASAATDEFSYPKFQTAEGTYVSMRYGIWDGASYNKEKLTFINLPTLKRHGMAGSTVSWKNLIGYVTASDTNRFGGWNEMHGFFWGYLGLGDVDYGLIGREIAQVTTPDLHVVDAIWIATQGNNSGNVSRQDILLASRDPFAVDWYASEYALYAIDGVSQVASAARAGTFRDATRVNQNSAELVWPGGAYPYMDLLDSYDGDTPSDDEANQMNVYLAGANQCDALTEAAIEGPTVGFTETVESFTAVTDPLFATTPITYTWSPEPLSGQGTAVSQYQWPVPGTYTVTLTAENCGGAFTATHTIEILDIPPHKAFLPVILRNP